MGTRPLEDLTGRKYGELTVLCYSKRIGSNAYWLCECSCGIQKDIQGSSLRSGNRKTCGNNHPKKHDLIGKTFGEWKVLEYFHSISGNMYWKCECSCGKIKNVMGDYLRKGRSKSCGHLKISNRKETKYNWYFLIGDEKKYCDSSYEVLFANYCMMNGLPIKYNDIAFNLSTGRYTPDFYNYVDDVFYEIKGDFDIYKSSIKQKSKILEFNYEHKINILFWKDLVQYCKLPYKSLKSYFDNATKKSVDIEDYLALKLYME